MFSAILSQIHHDPTRFTPKMLRRAAALHMIKYARLFFPYVQYSLDGESYLSYVTNIWEGNSWADDMVAAAIGHMFNIAITIVNPLFDKPLDLFHEKKKHPHVVIICNGGMFGTSMPATHFTQTRSRIINWHLPGHGVAKLVPRVYQDYEFSRKVAENRAIKEEKDHLLTRLRALNSNIEEMEDEILEILQALRKLKARKRELEKELAELDSDYKFAEHLQTEKDKRMDAILAAADPDTEYQVEPVTQAAYEPTPKAIDIATAEGQRELIQTSAPPAHSTPSAGQHTPMDITAPPPTQIVSVTPELRFAYLKDSTQSTVPEEGAAATPFPDTAETRRWFRGGEEPMDFDNMPPAVRDILMEQFKQKPVQDPTPLQTPEVQPDIAVLPTSTAPPVTQGASLATQVALPATQAATQEVQFVVIKESSGQGARPKTFSKSRIPKLSGPVPMEQRVRARFYCDKCPRSYSYKADAKKHMAGCGQEKEKIPCPVCNMGVKNELSLAEHMASAHTKIPLYHCDVCGKGFFHKARKSEHKDVCPGPPPQGEEQGEEEEEQPGAD